MYWPLGDIHAIESSCTIIPEAEAQYFYHTHVFIFNKEKEIDFTQTKASGSSLNKLSKQKGERISN